MSAVGVVPRGLQHAETQTCPKLPILEEAEQQSVGEDMEPGWVETRGMCCGLGCRQGCGSEQQRAGVWGCRKAAMERVRGSSTQRVGRGQVKGESPDFTHGEPQIASLPPP